jgi:hypothetical protein
LMFVAIVAAIVISRRRDTEVTVGTEEEA